MKAAVKFLVSMVGPVLLANAACAETPREQFKQMVEQLQKTSNDSALREKIIKLAPTLKPSPALPDAAVTFEGRAQYAFRSAKSEQDFLIAAKEYEKAVAVAPWVPGYYADLCTIYEKAGKLEDAKRHCGYYLIALTDPVQTTDVKRRIAGLEFGIEKANSPEIRAREQQEAVLRGLDGGIWLCEVYRSRRDTLEIKGNKIYSVSVNKDRPELNRNVLLATFTGREFTIPRSQICDDNLNVPYNTPYTYCDGTGRISADGKMITLPTMWNPMNADHSPAGRMRNGTDECRRTN